MKKLISQFRVIIYVFGMREALARSMHYAGLKIVGVKNYQRPLTKAIKRLSKDNETFIDVGAAGGDIVEEVATCFEKTIAIEPAPHHIKVLKSKISAGKLKKVVLIEHAVGESNGYAKLGLSSTNPDDNSLFVRDDIKRYVKVKKETVDEIVSRLNINGGIVIKIDVQGFEEFILLGAEKTMNQGCSIIMELWPWGMRQAGTDVRKLLLYINNLGYEIFNLNGTTYDKSRLEKIIYYGLNNTFVVDDIMLVRK